jgi:hypothetical protein
MGRKLMIYKPLPGERRILPDRAMPVCPYCAKELEINVHPKEKFIHVIGFAVVLNLLASFFKSNFLLILGGMALGLSLIVLVFLHFKYFRNWPRFKERSPMYSRPH